jgi:hypothetical protein
VGLIPWIQQVAGTIDLCKYVFQGVQKGFSRGVKSIRDLKNRILGKFKFKKFKVVRKGHWFELWGEVNPWVLVMTGELKGQVVKSDDPKLSGLSNNKMAKIDIGGNPTEVTVVSTMDDIAPGGLVRNKLEPHEFTQAQ